MPMLRVETILKFIKDCEKLKKPSFGVFEVNNYFCLINILSEIATRTYGFNQPIPRISQVVSDEWISKTKNGLDIKILGNL